MQAYSIKGLHTFTKPKREKNILDPEICKFLYNYYAIDKTCIIEKINKIYKTGTYI